MLRYFLFILLFHVIAPEKRTICPVETNFLFLKRHFLSRNFIFRHFSLLFYFICLPLFNSKLVSVFEIRNSLSIWLTSRCSNYNASLHLSCSKKILIRGSDVPYLCIFEIIGNNADWYFFSYSVSF